MKLNAFAALLMVFIHSGSGLQVPHIPPDIPTERLGAAVESDVSSSSQCTSSDGSSYEFMFVVDNSCSLNEDECAAQKSMMAELFLRFKNDYNGNRIGYMIYDGDDALAKNVRVSLDDELNDNTMNYYEWITSGFNDCGGINSGSETNLYSAMEIAQLELEIYGKYSSSQQKIILFNNCENTKAFLCENDECENDNELLCEFASDSEYEYTAINTGADVSYNYFNCLPAYHMIYAPNLMDTDGINQMINYVDTLICGENDMAENNTDDMDDTKQTAWEWPCFFCV